MHEMAVGTDAGGYGLGAAGPHHLDRAVLFRDSNRRCGPGGHHGSAFGGCGLPAAGDSRRRRHHFAQPQRPQQLRRYSRQLYPGGWPRRERCCRCSAAGPRCKPLRRRDSRCLAVWVRWGLLADGKPVPLLYASPSPINFQMLLKEPVGQPRWEVRVAGGVRTGTQVTVVTMAPGLFLAMNRDGRIHSAAALARRAASTAWTESRPRTAAVIC